MIPLFKVFMSPDAGPQVTNVLNSGYVGQGPKVEEFEVLLKNHFQNPNLVTVNSCTSALHLAFRLIENLPGDEVISTPLTCFASNASILANNLKIRWADVDVRTCNIYLEDVARKISKNTKAILVVHWGGYPVDLDQLRAIQWECKRLYGHEPPIIEDCAHAYGSIYKNRLIGNSGNFCAFSYQAIKTFSTCDGGLLVCPNEEYYKQAKLLRWFGLDRESSQDFRCSQDILQYGHKFHMNDVNASIGLANYPHIESLLRRHRENTAFYNAALASLPDISSSDCGLRLLENNSEYQSSSWIYTLLVNNRERFKAKMADQGIHVSQVHARNDTYTCTCTKEYRVCLPSLNFLSEYMISIPCGWWVSDEDREYVVAAIKKGW